MKMYLAFKNKHSFPNAIPTDYKLTKEAELLLKTRQQEELSNLYFEHQKVIKMMVFSGGGAKGGAYPGAYNALMKAGIFDNIKFISGASVGSVFAICAAFGAPSEFVWDKMVGVNIQYLVGQSPSFLKKIFGIHKDGKPFYEFMSKLIKECVQIGIDKYLTDLSYYTPAVQEIYAKCFDQKAEITFGDLKILNSLQPGYFKELFITAVEKSTGNPVVFGFEDRDLPIVLACRASISMPIVFEPIKIDGIELVDGGYYNNLPTLQNIVEYKSKAMERQTADQNVKDLNEDFTNSDDTNESTKENSFYNMKRNYDISRSEIILLGLGDGDERSTPIFKAMHSQEHKLYHPSIKYKFMDHICRKEVKGNYTHTERKEKEYKVIQDEYPLRTIELKTQDISTLDFEKATTRASQLALSGYYNAMDYLINHNMADITPKYQIQHFFFDVFQKTHLYKCDIKKNKIAEELYNYAYPDSKAHANKHLLDLLDEYIIYIYDNEIEYAMYEVILDVHTPKYVKDSIRLIIKETDISGHEGSSHYNEYD